MSPAPVATPALSVATSPVGDAPAAAVAGTSTASGSAADPTPSIEQEIFALTNQVRQANGLEALVLDPELTEAAQIQATAMAFLDIMDHTLPEMPEPTLASRLQFVGYDYWWAGENIASGDIDGPTVVALWMGSPDHEQNIMCQIAFATGVAVAYDSHGTAYFCQVFGEPR
jgi:uncharacterized protein YkwD